MPRKEATRMIRVGNELATKAEENAAIIGWSFNAFSEECIRIVCEMVEKPEKRVVPDVVRMLDTLRNSRAPILGGIQILENMADVNTQFPISRAAEDPTRMKKKSAG